MKYLICAICPVTGDYEAGVPEFGFIFPAFCDRTEDPDYIDIYENIRKDLIVNYIISLD